MTVDLALTDDQLAIQEAFSGFFAKESPPSVARAAEPLGFDRQLWEALRALEIPADAPLADLVVIAEAFGHAIAPVPLVDHLVAARLHGDPALASGELVGGVSLRPAVGGVWRLVPAGAVADVVVGVDGDEVVAVRSEPPGNGPRNHGCQPLADRSPDTGERTPIGAAESFDRALDEWKVLTAASLVGLAAAALEMGVGYVQARYQFGVPVGSFQAVQHGLADLPALVDGARLLTHKAAWAAARAEPGAVDVDGNDVTDAAALASMAFVFAAEAAATATDRSLHYHGGYGFSEEYDIQLHYRRARGWALVLDDPGRECRRLADRLFGAVEGFA